MGSWTGDDVFALPLAGAGLAASSYYNAVQQIIIGQRISPGYVERLAGWAQMLPEYELHTRSDEAGDPCFVVHQ